MGSLESEIKEGLQGAVLSAVTDSILEQANMRLVGSPEPNSHRTYTIKVCELALNLSRKHNPEQVLEAIKIYIYDIATKHCAA